MDPSHHQESTSLVTLPHDIPVIPETTRIRRQYPTRFTFPLHTLEECRSMSENSRKKKTRAVKGRDGCSEQDGHYRCGMANDVEWETVETDGESGEDDDRQNRQPADRQTSEQSSMNASPANIGLRRSTLLSTMLLSLLPSPTAAYPQSKSNTIRRDRRRSSNVKSSRGSERHSSERSEGFGRTEGTEERRRVRGSNRRDATMCSVENEGSTVEVQSSKVSPLHRMVGFRG